MTISSVSSSWLRRNRPHWQFGGISGVAQDLVERVASSRRSDMNMRGMTKWRAHVALVAVAEVLDHVLRPLVRFREQHAVWYFASISVRTRFR